MTKKTKTKAKLTIKEFQTWLEGIMEFQSDDWSPNKEQWNAIYDRIMNLKQESGSVILSAQSMNQLDEKFEEVKEFINDRGQMHSQNFNNPQHESRKMYEPSQPEGQLFRDDPEQHTHQNVGGGVPNNPIEVISAEEFPQLTPEQLEEKIENAKKGLKEQVDFSGGNKVSTPNIDTSSGSYKSNFT